MSGRRARNTDRPGHGAARARLRVPLLCAATMLAAAGCGPAAATVTGAPPPAPAGTSAAATSPAITEAPPASAAPSSAPAGILAAQCSSLTEATLATMDPTNGALTPTGQTIPLPTTNDVETYAMMCGPPAAGHMQRGRLSVWDATFTHVAVEEKGSNGQQAAGVLDVGSGGFTDYSTAVQPTGFSDNPIPGQAVGFDQAGDFYFTLSDGNTATWYEVPAGQGTATKLPREPDLFRLPSPDGSTAVAFEPDANGNAVVLEPPKGPAAALLQPQSQVDSPLDCTEALWLSARRLLCGLLAGEPVVVTVPASSTGDLHVTWVNLLPDSSRTNGDFLMSPDHTKLVFISTDSGGQESLWQMPPSPGHAPSKIADLPNGTRLLSWN